MNRNNAGIWEKIKTDLGEVFFIFLKVKKIDCYDDDAQDLRKKSFNLIDESVCNFVARWRQDSPGLGM